MNKKELELRLAQLKTQLDTQTELTEKAIKDTEAQLNEMKCKENLKDNEKLALQFKQYIGKIVAITYGISPTLIYVFKCKDVKPLGNPYGMRDIVFIPEGKICYYNPLFHQKEFKLLDSYETDFCDRHEICELKNLNIVDKNQVCKLIQVGLGFKQLFDEANVSTEVVDLNKV